MAPVTATAAAARVEVRILNQVKPDENEIELEQVE